MLMDQGGEFFTIANGKLMGSASGYPYSADLIGTLDCSTLKLEGGMLQNGMVNVLGVHKFEGPLTADYDDQKVAFVNGTWNVKEIGGFMGAGSGTWNAAHMP
jgi:hypothetical protein